MLLCGARNDPRAPQPFRGAPDRSVSQLPTLTRLCPACESTDVSYPSFVLENLSNVRVECGERHWEVVEATERYRSLSCEYWRSSANRNFSNCRHHLAAAGCPQQSIVDRQKQKLSIIGTSTTSYLKLGLRKQTRSRTRECSRSSAGFSKEKSCESVAS